MFIHKRPSPPAPSTPPDPDQDGEVRIFRSREHLAAWVRALDRRPQALRVVSPSHVGDLSATFALVADTPHGGAVLVLPARGDDVRGWLDEVRQEHGPKGLSAPWPVRVGDEAGLLVGVIPTEPPSTWEDWEPDAWPVPAAETSPLDARRVQTFMRALPFARPANRSEADHEARTLIEIGARRWFRGRLVPTIAGLVAFGEATDRFLPGCAIAVRRPGGHEQIHQGSVPWVARSIGEERSLWGPVLDEVVRVVLVLALAERAWAGPDALTPITLSAERDHLRLAIPTRAANRREQEDRAPGNPRLRSLLVRVGLLPAVPGVDIPDNDEILAQFDGRWPGLRNRYEDDVTWIEVPLRPGAPVVRGTGTAILPPSQPISAPDALAAAPAPAASALAVPASEVPVVPIASVAPAQPAVPAPLVPVAAPSAPRPVRASRPAPRREPPIFHPRSAPPPVPVAPPTTPAPPIAPPFEPAAPPTVAAVIPPPPAPPPPSPSTGPLTLDERKAQLREVFLQSERPIAARELAEMFGVHRDTLSPALKALIAEGWLAPTDPNPRSPVQRYRRVEG